MSITRHHIEWLTLVPNSGPFLSLPVLASAFPQGLDAHDADHARRLRRAFEEWDENQSGDRQDPSIHWAWIRLVLDETLGYAELLAERQEIPQTLKSDVAEYGETLRPDFVLNDPESKTTRLLIQFYPRSQSLTKPVAMSRWKTSPDTRMMQLLHDTGIRLGLVTNGDHWMLVNAPKNETTGYASWHANLWLDEPLTLRALRTLLSADRFFSVPANETLEALLDKSAADQQEVTDQLGYQVRKAVEVLIQALDKADQDHGRKLLADIDEKVLYESALTVMMRLVFLFCAEERELLLLGEDLYDKNYAVSTLREQLREAADQFGEEILGLRYDAWVRLLTTFRTVYAGVKHDHLQYTLEPLVYVGPAEGSPKEQWKLRSAKELLDLKICDMACGSGAFLVQACRYMAARLLEAWDVVQRANPGTLRITPDGRLSSGHPEELLIPDDADERQTYALRIVVQRCLYGVDKNPLAAEMAKLSLWLLTLAKDKPFEFLDHAIRCGDSLVGIHDLGQLRSFNLDLAGEENRLFLQFLDKRIEEVTRLRTRIGEIQAKGAEDVRAQERLLEEATEKIRRVKTAADMLAGAEFLRWNQHELIQNELMEESTESDDVNRPRPSWLRAKRETEEFRRVARLSATIRVASHFHDSELGDFEDEAQLWLNGERPFHWPLEFAEVFKVGGFDAFVCNPPFMGGPKITGNLSELYREHLVSQLSQGQRGNADLCAYFFLRAAGLLREGGQLGFLATNTIAQGDTREVGLERLAGNGYTISRAVPSRPWPGAANLEVAQVWLRRGSWSTSFTLEERTVSGITALLTERGALAGKPFRLAANSQRSFNGTKVYGQGFVLEPDEAKRLIAREFRNRDVLFPYVNGEDLTTRPDQSPSRWVINFFEWPLNRDSAPGGYKGAVAEDYPDCLEIVKGKVKPEREMLKDNPDGRRRKKYWWQYGRVTTGLNATIDGMERVLVCPIVAKYMSFCFAKTGIVFMHKVCVFAFDNFDALAVLSSNIHEPWVREFCSTLETRLNYSPADCFENFPLPHSTANVGEIGKTFDRHRRQVMVRRAEGITKIYNRLHEPKESFADIQELRDLYAEMDKAVAVGYGWTDLDLGHSFHETKQGIRFTISEAARREVLSRLLKLNHERYAEEVRQGLHETKSKRSARDKPKSKTTARKPLTTSPTLFEMDGVDPALPATDRERRLCGLFCDLVAAQPSLASDAYLDALVIALRPERHNRLLIDQDRTQFTALAGKLFKTKGRTEASIPWADLLDFLTQNEAIRKTGPKALDRGNRFEETRSTFPSCDPKLVQLILKAAGTLRELQGLGDSDPADSEDVLANHREDKRILCGAAT